jgi:hypothetical protein
MTGFNVALRMRRDRLVAKYAKHLKPLVSPKNRSRRYYFRSAGRGVVIALES